MVVRHELWSCTTIGYDDVQLGILWPYDMRLPYRTTMLIDFPNFFFYFTQLANFQSLSQNHQNFDISEQSFRIWKFAKNKAIGRGFVNYSALFFEF